MPPVERDWTQLLDQRIDLIHFTINQGDSQLMKAVFAQDQSSTVDYPASFYDQAKALGAEAFERGSNVIRDLEHRALETNKRIKGDTDQIRQSMEELANNGDNNNNPEEWERNIDENIDRLQETSYDQLEELRNFGKKKIHELPSHLRRHGAYAFMGAISGIFVFRDNAETFLKVALDDVQTWYQQPEAKVKEFDDITQRWYEGSRNTTKGWFGGAHLLRGVAPLAHAARRHHGRRHRHGRRNGPADNLPEIKDIATKLQCMGLDSFTIVRKGNGWALEIDSPA
ncbi:hypothetical protein SLS58_007799 [Diplodia intermedia]|uniref:Uncharacterized protein n=1 Tax=Diplodia intermedia TaxID=856260 RepID=A0ABR3TJ89_9PEZI